MESADYLFGTILQWIESDGQIELRVISNSLNGLTYELRSQVVYCRNITKDDTICSVGMQVSSNSKYSRSIEIKSPVRGFVYFHYNIDKFFVDFPVGSTILHIDISDNAEDKFRINLTREQEQKEYDKVKARVLKNYRKKEMEKRAILELIEEGVIFQEDDPDLKYLQQLKRKYKLDI